jgi:serine/threonine protein kinase
MEYVNGGELFRCLRAIQRLSVSAARFYAAETLLAIQYLHSMGIVHRDIKVLSFFFLIEQLHIGERKKASEERESRETWSIRYRDCVTDRAVTVLQPENLLLDHVGHVKLSDFGFAKQVVGRYDPS